MSQVACYSSSVLRDTTETDDDHDIVSATVRNIPILKFYTKKNCPLCDEAKVKLEPFKHLFEYEEVDITVNGLYRYEIPVISLGNTVLKNKAITHDSLTALFNDHVTSDEGQ